MIELIEEETKERRISIFSLDDETVCDFERIEVCSPLDLWLFSLFSRLLFTRPRNIFYRVGGEWYRSENHDYIYIYQTKKTVSVIWTIWNTIHGIPSLKINNIIKSKRCHIWSRFFLPCWSQVKFEGNDWCSSCHIIFNFHYMMTW